jgi:hypothetical protein
MEHRTGSKVPELAPSFHMCTAAVIIATKIFMPAGSEKG